MRILTVAALMALTAGSAVAQDLIVYGGAKLEFTRDEFGPDTGGITYLKTYVELESNGLYGGVWARMLDDSLRNRADPYLGYRNELANGVSYDFGVYRYNYVNDPASSSTEPYLVLGIPVGDKLSTTLELYYDVTFETGSVYTSATYAVNDKLSVSADYGVYEVTDAESESEWDLGATWALNDETSVDLRYYDGSEYLGSYWGLSLAWDATLLGG